MIELELNNEAFEEVRDKCVAAGLIEDEPREWDQDSKPFTVGGITFKEYKYVPTPEEIARQEEYSKTPLGKLMAELAAHSANRFLGDLLKPNYMDGVDTSGMKIGTALRIRLPNDHFNKIGDEWLDK